jgi:uncharacterized protein (TIGR00290 family)
LKKVLLSWSSGKDSAWTLYRLQQSSDFEPVGLFTTVNEAADRVAMHGVRRSLLLQQAARVGLPMDVIGLPHPCSNAQYEAALNGYLATLQERDVDGIAFGDLFLADVREYRERRFRDAGFELLFPIWGEDTTKLARTMVDAGLRARVSCVDPGQLAGTLAGREFDAEFLDALPDSVDPCGENGEFHTFVFAGPMFATCIAVSVGETLTRDGFVYTDLLPGD